MSNDILKVTQERVSKLLSCNGEVFLKIQSGRLHFRVKYIASTCIARQIMSMENDKGNAVRFKNRYFHQDILSRFNWNSYIKLSLRTLE